MQNKSTQEFDDIIRNIIENQKVQEMKKYKQHYETSTFDHCYMVSYYCYKVCKKLKLIINLQQEQECYMIFSYMIGE